MANAVQDVSAVKQEQKLDMRVLWLALATFVLGTDVLIVVGVLPAVASEMHVTEGMAGQLITVFSLVYGLGGPLLAALVGRWRRSRVILVSLGAFCLVNIGSALSPSFAVLMLTRVLGGVFAALISPLAYATAISLAPPAKRGQALALVMSGMTISQVLGGPLGTWVGGHMGWRFSFGLVALLAGLTCIVLSMTGLPDGKAAQALSLKVRLAPIAEPRLLLALAPAFLATVGFTVVYSYVAPLLQLNLHIKDISLLLLVLGLGTVVASQLVGRIIDRFGSARLLVICLAMQLVLNIAIAYVTTSWVGAVIALFFWGASGPSFFIAQQHRLLNLAPEHANVISALTSSVSYLGIACGSALGGVILAYVQITQLGWFGGACALVGMVLLLTSLKVSDTGKQHE